jgi:hypothetical protein
MRTTLITWKERTNYVAGYMSLFTMPLLLADLIQKKLIVIGIGINYVTIVLIGLLFLFCAGYYVDKFGLIEAEQKYAYRHQKIKWVNK